MTLEIDYYLDIIDEVCPITFVNTKLKLEKMSTGQRLEVRLSGGEPMDNVPKSVEEMGHCIVSCTADPSVQDRDVFVLLIEKK
jgi:TusA-related sulfurtransferase